MFLESKNKVREFILWGITSMFLFVSCASEKSEVLIFTSQDKNLIVYVSGEKPNIVDPWNVNITLDIFGKKITKGIECYSRKLDNSTVLCDWNDQGSCVLTFVQQDDTKRVFLIEGNEDMYSFRDISDAE
jgi:hypothetical protein